MNSIFSKVTGLFRYLFHIGYVVVGCVFKGIGSFHLSCKTYAHRIVCSVPLVPLDVLFDVWLSAGSIVISHFTSDTGNLCFLFFSLSVLLEVYQFYCSFQEINDFSFPIDFLCPIQSIYALILSLLYFSSCLLWVYFTLLFSFQALRLLI